jgi:lysophospholipase L1-like esterase
MSRTNPLFLAIATLPALAGTAPAQPTAPAVPAPPVLRDGDRVILIGSALVERDAAHGYLETILTARFPRSNIVFRNLGWSGDTVFGHARAGFGTTADGFKHLREHVQALNPTVLIVGYGMAESFEGDAGLAAFTKGLETMLDAVTAGHKPRLVFLSPNRHEDLGRPLPDPAAHNRALRKYAHAIRDVAARRAGRFIDLFARLDGGPDSPSKPLTDNGIHLTEFGYRRLAAVVSTELGVGLPARSLSAATDGARVVETSAKGARITGADGPGLPIRFNVLAETLPAPDAADTVVFLKLRPGRYTLTVDGKPVATATAEQWAAGVAVSRGPDFEQVAALRKAINAKNVHYFNRWRPQNETYLFGFRKHEQGRNAAEIPQFDPLVAEAEKSIARLRVPVERRYELAAATE